MIKNILWLLCLTSPLMAMMFSGTVTQVKDGDTLVVKRYQKELVIRLAHINAPELKKYYGKEAKQALTTWALNQYALVYATEQDDYKRWIGTVMINNEQINKRLVREGYAIWYEEFSNDTSYEALQEKAKRERKGVWSLLGELK